MILCITEKPSVAKDIANILGANDRHDGFYEGNGYQVSWTYGHLCMLKEPHDYTPMWKQWALSYLPMIPQRFSIKLIDQPSIIRQFHVLETLIGKCDQVINCGDAGQEGELIQRWVMQKANCSVPVLRLWISSLTDESIRKGFEELKPQKDYDNLYYAGLSRAIGDWVLGMNATRLYSLKYSSPGNVLSIGRVQTPTLALIIKRHFEIVNFRPEDYWELKTLYRDVTFNATSGKFTSIEKANAALEKIKGKPFTVTDVQQKKGKESPPRLFDLTSLQVECNKIFGWTADQTLKLIQSCYEKKVTTYPRVDTTYLTDDIYQQVPVILQKMTPYAPLTAAILSKKIPKSKKVFDNSKVTDHHAIIPTGESPSVLVGNERHLYHLIALRFIAAFYPDCVFSQTTVTGKVEDTGFKAVGKVILDPGWRVLFDKPKPKPDPNRAQAPNQSQQSAAGQSDNGGDPDSDSDRDDSEDRILPPMTVGESGPHNPSLIKKTTQPPKYYTEGTLLRAMETAGKTVDDDELRDAMKENGIGRPSTRSAIIETLFKRRYIERKRRQIVPTPAGIQLIGTIKEELLKSAKLTGLWENKLRKIEKGEYTAADFINELKEMIHKITFDVLNDIEFKKIEIDNSEHHHHSSSASYNGSGNGSNSGAATAGTSSGNTTGTGTGKGSGKRGSKKKSSDDSSTTGATGTKTSTRGRRSKKTDPDNNTNTQPSNPGPPNSNNPSAQGNNPSTPQPNNLSAPDANHHTNPPGNTATPRVNPGAQYGYGQQNINTGLQGYYPPNTANGNMGYTGSYPQQYPNGANPNYPTPYPGNQGTVPPANYYGTNGSQWSQGSYPQGYPNGHQGYNRYQGGAPLGSQNNPNYPAGNPPTNPQSPNATNPNSYNPNGYNTNGLNSNAQTQLSGNSGAYPSSVNPPAPSRPNSSTATNGVNPANHTASNSPSNGASNSTPTVPPEGSNNGVTESDHNKPSKSSGLDSHPTLF